MPNYNYKCECGYTTTKTHSIDTDPHYPCPECQLILFRVPSFQSVKFIGKDFYSTSS